MFRVLFRLLLILILLVLVGGYMLGWRPTANLFPSTSARPNAPAIDTSRARAVGAEIGAKASEAASQAGAALSDGSVTAKIKAKMALDDTVDASGIHVEFDDGRVTLTGTVRSAAERQRAVDLARETKGVTAVNDKLALTGR